VRDEMEKKKKQMQKEDIKGRRKDMEAWGEQLQIITTCKCEEAVSNKFISY
jgi:hypothetical protein